MPRSTGPRRTRRGTGRRRATFPEEVWNESALNGGAGLWASGGGASTVYAQPAWQAVVNGAGAANGMRAVPDVALSAANHDGYFIGGERIALDCFGNFGGIAGACRRDGVGGEQAERR